MLRLLLLLLVGLCFGDKSIKPIKNSLLDMFCVCMGLLANKHLSCIAGL